MSEQKTCQRVYGSELEYEYTYHADVSQDYKTMRLSAGLKEFVERSGGLDDFLPNGMRLYGDVSGIEGVTAECTSLDMLVAAEVAADAVTTEAVEASGLPVTLYRRVGGLAVSGSDATHGAHENYQSTIDFRSSIEIGRRTLRLLGTHLATRTIFTGAGTVVRGGFKIGQKMGAISQLYGSDTLNNKPMLVAREEESHARRKEYRRIQVASGDANWSPWALRMKYGTTSLVLRMIEHGYLPPITFHDPVPPARIIAESLKGLEHQHEIQGSPLKLTAGQIQHALASSASVMAQEVQLPKEELEVLSEWLKYSELAAEGEDIDATYEETDWYHRYNHLQRCAERANSFGKLALFDLMYDRLPQDVYGYIANGEEVEPRPNYGHGLRRRTAIMRGTQLVANSITYATDPPPTRAQARSRAIALINELRTPRLAFDVDWSELTVSQNQPPHDTAKFKFGDGDDPMINEEYLRQLVEEKDMEALFY